MHEGPLFLNDGQAIGSNDLVRALKEVGAEDGDSMFVHSDLTSFGKLAPGVDRSQLCETVIGALESSAQDVTVVMPTFNYGFCRNGFFDLDNTPSEVGMLTEFFRKQPGVIRSKHPVISVAAHGPRAREIVDIDMDAFGKNSVFAHLHNMNGLIVFLGVTFPYVTFVHYVEQIRGVPYRFTKEFTGTMREGGKDHPVSCTYLVRKTQNTDIDYGRIESALREKGQIKETKFGAGALFAVRSQDLYDTVMNLIKDDPGALYTEIPPEDIKVRF